jgi:hypothetical protein
MYFTVPWTPEIVHPEESQEIPLPTDPLIVLLGSPVVSKVKVSTSVPSQTEIRVSFILSKPGLMMFPVIAWETFELFVALWPLPIV